MLPQFFLATVATTRKQGRALIGETTMETEALQRHCVEVAAFLSANANPKRLSILQLLTQSEHSVGELSYRVGLSQRCCHSIFQGFAGAGWLRPGVTHRPSINPALRLLFRSF